MTDTAMPEDTVQAITAAVATAATAGSVIGHGTARAIAEHFTPGGRAPRGRAIYRRALKEFIASGAMRFVNVTPPRWAPRPDGERIAAQALFEAVAGEGQWGRGSDRDRDVLAAFGDYLQARQSSGDLAGVPGWPELPANQEA